MRVAAVQLNSTRDAAANLAAADDGVRAAAADGASLVVLPEKFSVFGSPADLRAGAESIDGPAITWARATARELGIDLIAGSICERGEPKLHNTSLHIGRDGEILGAYRKVHMFDVTVDGQKYHESADEQPGDRLVVTSAGGVNVGMSICYDLRFPELYRALAVGGVELFAVPAAFTLATTRDHWEVLLRARAIEDQCFVVAANQIGESAGLRSGGRSMIVDPWGVVLAVAPDRVGHIVADLDLDAQRRIRRELPSLANRRPEVTERPEAVV